MKEWEIWSEGYLVSGMEGIPATAQLEGKFHAETFSDACKKWAETLPVKEQKLFNPVYLTFWGCKLFDNEADARKSFG